MMSRRDALKSLALTAGAAAWAHTPLLASSLTGVGPRLQPAGGTPAAAAPPAAPTGPFTLPPLPYAPDALEPHLDAQTMTIHHDKHHAAYVNNLNKAVAGKADLMKMSVEDLLRHLDTVPAEVRTAVRNQGGGHANHSLLWPSLKKDGAQAPTGELAKAIDKTFASFSAYQDKFNAAAMSVFGSGWAWLTCDPKQAGLLAIEISPNQDSAVTAGRVPLVGIDVWEHAYYLKFQNRRADYVAEFAKVVDWDTISSRYRDALKG
jgi:Fe-Mn family superoxide dismutase